MVLIPKEVLELIHSQKVIVVGSVDLNGVANISPRTAFHVLENEIYWLDFFKHKSQGNFKSLPWVSVAIFDKNKLRGFQLKGKVSFITDTKQKTKIIDIVTRSSTGKTSSKIFERLSQNKTPDVIMFKPRAIYSLNPQDESGRALVMDADGETISLLGI